MINTKFINCELDNQLLSTRVKNCLCSANINSIEELVIFSYSDLMELPNFGKQCLLNVIEFLKLKGKTLRVMPPKEYFNGLYSSKRH